MTIKQILVIGGVIAAGVYLQNKSRRDRLFAQARDLLDMAKSRASDVAHRIEQQRDEMTVTARDNGVGTTTDAGAPGYGGFR